MGSQTRARSPGPPCATSRRGPSARVGDPHAAGARGDAQRPLARRFEVGEAERCVREDCGGARAHGGGRARADDSARSWMLRVLVGEVARRAKAMLEAERG